MDPHELGAGTSLDRQHVCARLGVCSSSSRLETDSATITVYETQNPTCSLQKHNWICVGPVAAEEINAASNAEVIVTGPSGAQEAPFLHRGEDPRSTGMGEGLIALPAPHRRLLTIKGLS